MGHKRPLVHVYFMGWRVGSVVRPFDCMEMQRPRVRIPSGAQETIVSFSESKMLCWVALGVPNLRVYTHAQEWSRTHVEDRVAHVRVRRITETRKNPARTLIII